MPVFRRAICVELAHLGLAFDLQQVFPLAYCGEYVGAHVAHLIVNGTIILELKSCRSLSPVIDAQTIKYLKLMGLPVGCLLSL